MNVTRGFTRRVCLSAKSLARVNTPPCGTRPVSSTGCNCWRLYADSPAQNMEICLTSRRHFLDAWSVAEMPQARYPKRSFASSSIRRKEGEGGDVIAKQAGQHAQTGSGNAKQGRGKTSTELKIAISVAVGVVSYFFNQHFERQETRKRSKLDLINRQIKDLYGPLYGIRLVQETTFRAVMGEHTKLVAYLKEAETRKDARMIRRWRAFVLNVLYPLDREAEELIRKNAHLIADSEFPEEFTNFLVHLAHLRYVMQSWKRDDGKLEREEQMTDDDFLERNNASGMRGMKRMLAHVEEKYRELRAKQKELSVDLSDDHANHELVDHLLKPFSSRK